MLSSCSLQNILCLSINFLGKKKFSVDVSHRPGNIVEIQYTLGEKKKKKRSFGSALRAPRHCSEHLGSARLNQSSGAAGGIHPAA